jgi:hypothetical protein
MPWILREKRSCLCVQAIQRVFHRCSRFGKDDNISLVLTGEKPDLPIQ